MIIKGRKHIKFRNECNCKVDLNELRKAVNWFSSLPVSANKKIFISAKYPTVAIFEKKIHVHRLLMMYWLKRDLDTNEYVHHKDGDRLNSLKQNLELIDSSEHQRNHNLGKKISENQRKAIIKSNKRRKGTKYKKSHENPELLKSAVNRGKK